MSTAWIEQLMATLGADHVITDAESLRFFSQDVFGEGALPAAVVAPPTVDALAAAIGRLTAHGVAIVPRGGGLSYTDGYLMSAPRAGRAGPPPEGVRGTVAEQRFLEKNDGAAGGTTAAGFVTLDLRRLDRLVELNLADRYVTVECGMTWAALDQLLEPHGLRTPYWGPLSGLHSTVGGALSQGSIFLGSGQHGAVGDSLLSLQVVLADGSLMTTGSAAAAGTAPFLRWFGPDATGCFVGDAGALGVKARATFRLIARPREIAFASCEFAGPLPLFAAMAEVSRAGLAAECFAFDPVLTEMRKKRTSLMSDAKTLLGVMKQSGLRAGLSLALAGRDFIAEDRWSAHVSIEAHGKGELAEKLAAARALLGREGSETENSFPKALRGMPFTVPNTMLGPAGERWVPVHGIFPHSAVPKAFEALEALFAANAAAMREHGLRAGYLCTTIAQQATLIEPVLYWGDSHTLYHRRMVEPEYRAKAGEPSANPAATALAGRLKRELADRMRAHGGTHFQIGRFYRWREGRDPAALALHDAMKAALDPKGLMNPGVLG